MAQLDKSMTEARLDAKVLGFKFPKDPPEAAIIGAKSHPNLLFYSEMPTLKLPHPFDPTSGCKSLTQGDADQITKNHQLNYQMLEVYREDLVAKIGKRPLLLFGYFI